MRPLRGQKRTSVKQISRLSDYASDGTLPFWAQPSATQPSRVPWRKVLVVVSYVLGGFVCGIFYKSMGQASRPQQDMGVLTMVKEGIGRDLSAISRVLVVPGGGPGRPEDREFPPWTKRCAERALAAYKEAPAATMFLLLSAGSMHGANARTTGGAVLFESTATSQFLLAHGVPPHDIAADIASWDTVANGWATRCAVEGLLAYRDSPLAVEIFTSDFHANRMQAIMEWMLYGISPSLQPRLTLRMIPLATDDIFSSAASRQTRAAHEKGAVQQIKNLAAQIHTRESVQAYLLLGGHVGLHNYSLGIYRNPPKGAGWTSTE